MSDNMDYPADWDDVSPEPTVGWDDERVERLFPDEAPPARGRIVHAGPGLDGWGRDGVRREAQLTPDEAADALPEAEELAEGHHATGLVRIREGWKSALDWWLPDVQHVAGPIDGGALVMLLAKTGDGKTTFLTNVWDSLVSGEEGHVGLFVGTEQAPDVLKIKWACARAGVEPRIILAPETWERGTDFHQDAMRRVERELETINTLLSSRAIYAPTRELSRAELAKWIRGAKRKYGITFAIIDHLDRVGATATTSRRDETSNLTRFLKEMAVENDVRLFGASQVRRAQAGVQQWAAPTLEDFAESSDKEREADLALAVYRVIRHNVIDEDFKAVRERRMDVKTLYEPGVMGFKCLKHRIDDNRRGRYCLLSVRGARVEQRDHAEKVDDLAGREGLRTSATVLPFVPRLAPPTNLFGEREADDEGEGAA